MLATVLAAASLISGCATLDARPDVERSAAAMEHAVGAPAELLLHDGQAAAAITQELLAGGLTADEAVQVALLHNPGVRAATLSIGVSRADFAQSTLFSNPSLFLSLRFPDGGGRPNIEVNLAQSIAELWMIPARKEAAGRDIERVTLEAARTASAVVLDTRRAYVRAVAAGSQIGLADEGLAIARKLVELAELRQQAGSGSEVDVNLAQAQELAAEANLRNAQLAAIEVKSQLCRLLGLVQAPQQLVLEDNLAEPAAWDVAAESLQAIARQARLDLQIMAKRVATAEALARLERVRFLRSAEVGFAFELAERRPQGDRNWLAETFYESAQAARLTPPNLMPRERVSTDTIAGPTLSLELPIWDRNQAQIARADRLLEQTRQLRDALLVDLAQDIHSGLARVRTAAENARFYREELVPSSERSVKLAEEGYRIGRAPYLSLLEAQRAYLTTRAGQLHAWQNALLAQIELERATGRPASVLLAAPKSTRTVPDNSTNQSTVAESTP